MFFSPTHVELNSHLRQSIIPLVLSCPSRGDLIGSALSYLDIASHPLIFLLTPSSTDIPQSLQFAMKPSLLSALPLTVAAAAAARNTVNQTTCGDTTYSYTGLAGYGFVPSNATDKYGDTLGGYGSSAAIDQSSWRKTGNDLYTGIFYTLPDRGW